MDIQVVSSFVVMAAALFIGSRRSGLTINNKRIDHTPRPSSPEKIVEDYYSAYLEKEDCEELLVAKDEATEQAAPGMQTANREWAWPVMTPDHSRPRGIMVENARVDGNQAIVPVRAGYLNPSGDMDLRWKFGVVMEKVNGQWQIAGTYSK
jgi:hypothetical protein